MTDHEKRCDQLLDALLETLRGSGLQLVRGDGSSMFRISGERTQYDAYCAALYRETKPAEQPTLSARLGHLKHGPGGSGLSGPCDADCRKCEVERAAKVDGLTSEQCLERWSWNRAKVEQFGPRASDSPMYTLTPAQVATAKRMYSDAADKTWSRVLRAKVEASRKADADRKASVVNAWDPEDM